MWNRLRDLRMIPETLEAGLLSWAWAAPRGPSCCPSDGKTGCHWLCCSSVCLLVLCQALAGNGWFRGVLEVCVCGCRVRRLDVGHVCPVPAWATTTVRARAVLGCPSVTPRHSLDSLTLPLHHGRRSPLALKPWGVGGRSQSWKLLERCPGRTFCDSCRIGHASWPGPTGAARNTLGRLQGRWLHHGNSSPSTGNPRGAAAWPCLSASPCTRRHLRHPVPEKHCCSEWGHFLLLTVAVPTLS